MRQHSQNSSVKKSTHSSKKSNSSSYRVSLSSTKSAKKIKKCPHHKSGCQTDHYHCNICKNNKISIKKILNKNKTTKKGKISLNTRARYKLRMKGFDLNKVKYVIVNKNTNYPKVKVFYNSRYGNIMEKTFNI